MPLGGPREGGDYGGPSWKGVEDVGVQRLDEGEADEIVRPVDTEIDVRYAEARLLAQKPATSFPGMTYEQGVANALAWVLGKERRNPLLPKKPAGSAQ